MLNLINLIIIIFMLVLVLLVLAFSNLFSRFNVKLICSCFLSLSLSLIRCLNLLYNLILNYEQFYVINVINLGNFGNLSIDQVFSIYSITITITHVISYLSEFTYFMIILLAANNFIVMLIEYNFIQIELIFFKIIINIKLC